MAGFTPQHLDASTLRAAPTGRRFQFRDAERGGSDVSVASVRAHALGAASNDAALRNLARDAGWRGPLDALTLAELADVIPAGTAALVAHVDANANNVGIVAIWRRRRDKALVGATFTASIPFAARLLQTTRGILRAAGEPLGAPAPAPAPATTPAASGAAPSAAPSSPSAPLAMATPSAPAAAGSLDAIIGAIIAQHVDGRIAALEERLADVVARTASAAPAVHHVRVADRPAVALSRRPHARMAHVLARLAMARPDGGRFNVFLTGDAGTGKSSIAEACAEALGVPFTSLNCSGGLTEGALVGRVAPNLTTGEQVYTAGPLVRAFRDGGLFLLDEMDAADENVLLALNTLADAKAWHTPTGDRVERHPDFYLLAAGNTYGTGASRLYSGRNQLDAAFLNRWLTVSVDYDVELERSLVACRELADKIHAARVTMRQRGMRRWLTTRDLLKADALVGQLGVTVRDALLEVTEGWTAEDRTACGIA